jgi:NAD/NADP transhydrogenase alpha subunit
MSFAISPLVVNFLVRTKVTKTPEKVQEAKTYRTYLNTLASITETACFVSASAAAASFLVLGNTFSDVFPSQIGLLALLSLPVAPVLGSIASQFATPKSVEKETAPLSKESLNVNRMITRGAFGIASASLATMIYFNTLGDEPLGLGFIAAVGIGSLSALFEKHAFKK